jgi:hypothetical protein
VLRLKRREHKHIVQLRNAAVRSENPGVGGSIPSLPTIFPDTSCTSFLAAAAERDETVTEVFGMPARDAPPPSCFHACASNS